MFNNLKKCKQCKSELIDGPSVERSARARTMACKVRNIPTNVCPNGCSGFYWYWLDFGVEVIDMLAPQSPNIAKRKLGLFKSRHFCKKCNLELENAHDASDFIFKKILQNGAELELLISALTLACPRCMSRFLPAQTSSYDKFYEGLSDLISQAITDKLIYE